MQAHPVYRQSLFIGNLTQAQRLPACISGELRRTEHTGATRMQKASDALVRQPPCKPGQAPNDADAISLHPS
jgi:hypothetical protein